MTISESLGEAFLVKKEFLKGNQSPNAIAKGDLFCLNITTKDTKITKAGKAPQREYFFQIFSPALDLLGKSCGASVVPLSALCGEKILEAHNVQNS